jgi:hypothetical protein
VLITKIQGQYEWLRYDINQSGSFGILNLLPFLWGEIIFLSKLLINKI